MNREERLAANEARFRDINQGAEGRRLETNAGRYVCECANSGCVSWIVVDRDDYERVRANQRLFFVLPGHEQLDIETVVERTDDYVVVEKPDEVAHMVET
jgi:hypothetical protein